MILIQLKEPPLSLFVKMDYQAFFTNHAANIAPYAQVKTLRGKKAIIPLKDNTNIAYVRESSDQEAEKALKPPDRPTIEQPGMIIGKRQLGDN